MRKQQKVQKVQRGPNIDEGFASRQVFSQFNEVPIFPQNFEGCTNQKQIRSDQFLKDQVQSQNIHVSSSRINKRSKISNAFKKSLIELSSINNEEQKDQPSEKTVVGSYIVNRLKSFKKKKKCQICQIEFKRPPKQHICNCQHKQNFCENCLESYVIYKVSNYEQVFCPDETCNKVINIQSKFFKHLPLDVQRKYHKINKFHLTAKSPHLKLCSTTNCEGVLDTTKEPIFCSLCTNQFCKKCLLAKHDGECDKGQVQLIQKTFNYKRCKKCKFIIQKSQGCNHMRCRCGFELCYVCGEDWDGYKDHTHDTCCEDWEQDCPIITFLIKFPFRIVFSVLFFCLFLFSFVSRDLIALVLLTSISIFAGVFAYSIEFLTSFQFPMCLLMVLLFPVCIIYGIGKGFQQIFGGVIPDMLKDSCRFLTDGYSEIWTC